MIFGNIFSKTIFSDSSIVAYLFVDLIVKNYNSIINLNKQTKPIKQIKFYQIYQTQTAQQRMDKIKKDNIEYYNKTYTSEWAKKYQTNKIILNELKKHNINIKY